MSSSSAPAPVIVDYSVLADSGSELTSVLETALGPHGLGLILVRNVPGFVAARAALLPLARAFAGLPSDTLSKYECAESRYNVGWSHGKEAMENGKLGSNEMRES